MIEQLLPARVRAHEVFADVPVSSLHPREAALVQDAVESRRQEFATGRHCARRALASLGVPPGPLLATPRGAPRWPAGVCGAITHCAGYRAAAVARAPGIRAVGIDAEPDRPLPEGVLEAVALPAEQLQIKEHTARHPGVVWGKLLFSAKESVYKAWFPATGRPLDFEEALIDLDPVRGTFHVRVLPTALRAAEPELRDLHGRWLVRHGIIVTAVVVDGPGRDTPHTPSPYDRTRHSAPAGRPGDQPTGRAADRPADRPTA
ncbi:4'-phosphopantetheinyl transferase superfamily protein [Streptomyces avermitilis]|uniref:4'-phosphopantetheinyl transferase family protein n=1 Tax=Streptomyces avermitilis TaxID=33903 RepID=UPI0033CB6519